MRARSIDSGSQVDRDLDAAKVRGGRYAVNADVGRPETAFSVRMDRGPGRENLPATWALSFERVTGIEPALSAWELPIFVSCAKCCLGRRCPKWPRLPPVALLQWHAKGTVLAAAPLDRPPLCKD